MQRVVTVVGLAGFVNGDFADGLDGWATWFNESQGVAATYSVTDGVVTIDITEQSQGEDGKDNNWWDVQLSQRTLALTAFESYTLKFTVSAESARKMMVQVQGGGLSTKPINEHMVDVTTEPVEHTIDFFAKEDSTSGVELQFALGTFYKVDGVDPAQQTVLGEVYISNVSIIAGPVLENQAPVLSVGNVLLKVGATDFLVKQGITVNDDFDNLTIDDVTYTDTSETPFVIGEPAVKGTYTFEYSVTDSDGVTTTATRNVYVADPYDVPDFYQVDSETDLPVGWTSWFEDTHGGLVITSDEVNGEVSIEITKADDATNGGAIWQNQFKVLDLAAFNGAYQLTFEAKADTARAMVVAMEGNGGIGLSNTSFVQELTTDWATYTYEFMNLQDATVMNRNLQFWFGTLSAQDGYTAADDILTTVHLRNVDIIRLGDIGTDVSDTYTWVLGFWNSTDTASPEAVILPDETYTFPANFASIDHMFDATELPNGTIIVIDSGYKFRANFYTALDQTPSTNTRSSNIIGSQVIIVDDNFWKNDTETVFGFVTFTVSYENQVLMTETSEVQPGFHIYLSN